MLSESETDQNNETDANQELSYLSTQLQKATDEARRFKKLYKNAVNDIKLVQNRPHSSQSLMHPPTIPLDSRICEKNQNIICKQQQHIEILLNEQTRTNKLIEQMYLREQNSQKEIQILHRALQLKATAEKTTIASLKQLAGDDLNLTPYETDTVLRS